jgi:hypothetical protein
MTHLVYCVTEKSSYRFILQRRNDLHLDIKFVMELEKNELLFLYVLVRKNSDGSLGHSVYIKPIHTNLNRGCQTLTLEYY